HGQPTAPWRPNGPPTLPPAGPPPAGPPPVQEAAPPREGPLVDPALKRVVFEPEGPAAPAKAAAALAVEIVGPERVAPGEPLAATLVVRNLSQAVAADVRVELPLPAGARLLSAEPRPANDEHPSWALGSVEAGGEKRVRG